MKHYFRCLKYIGRGPLVYRIEEFEVRQVVVCSRFRWHRGPCHAKKVQTDYLDHMPLR